MASRGRGARTKGANFERELAKKFNIHLIDYFESKRGLGQTRGGEGNSRCRNALHSC